MRNQSLLNRQAIVTVLTLSPGWPPSSEPGTIILWAFSPTVLLIFIGPEVDVDDVAHSLDVHVLSHHLPTDVDRRHVVAGLDEIPRPSATEESATTFASAPRHRWAERRRFGGTEIELAGSAATKSTAATTTLTRRGVRATTRPHGVLTL